LSASRQPDSRGTQTATTPDSAVDASGEPILSEEPERIVERATAVGRERLDRSALDILITGFIGGAEVSLGGLVAVTLTGAVLTGAPSAGLYGALAVGALAFPIGFLFVILGRSELFTENFLIPVVAVFNRERSVPSLIELWGLSWVGNLAGCAAMAVLLVQPKALGDPILAGYRAYAEYKLAMPAWGLFVSAVLAGMVMTILTWLLLAVPNPVAKVLVIFAAGYVLFAANLAHSIVGSSLLFVGYRLAGRPLIDVVIWIALATAGNLAGGIGFVTLFRLAQVWEKERQRQGET
jgi:formate/nitrite transporter FocA (FNT family)